MKKLICGIGESKILKEQILIKNYPFEPSSVYPEKTLSAHDITAICYEAYPPQVRIKGEVIFISRENYEALREFAKLHKLKTYKATRNWDWLLEPYLDTEYTRETEERITALLMENGISKKEIIKIRNEVQKQMLKYNFDTLLWDWTNLGLHDVLSAMRAKYNKAKFEDFYQRAMEIELRGSK